MSKLRRTLVVALTSIALMLVGTAAYAIVTFHSGSTTDQQRFVHDTNPFATAAAAFVNVPPAAISITTTSTHMFDARFTAESRCIGNVGWCSVRIVVFLPSGAIMELDPVVGPDFAFDSVGPDQAEGHAIERASVFLAPGTYRFQVQTGVVAGAAQVVLDDWTFVVEAINP